MGAAIPDGARIRIRLDGAVHAAPDAAVAMLLSGDTFTVHRLVRRGRSPVARRFVVTHGDGNIFCDAPQRVTDLLGTVIAVRHPDASQWVPVAPPARLRLWRRAVTLGFERIMSAALEVHPRLGVAVKNALVMVMKPLVWLRPYDAGRERTASRLIVASQPPAG